MLKCLVFSKCECVDTGLLILRVGIGAMFVFHGFPKLMGGPEGWAGLAGYAGITIMPTFFGLMAAIAETVGGLMLALGLFTRIAATLLLLTMVTAAYTHLSKGDGLKGAAHAIEAGILFLSFIFMGAGQYSVDKKIEGGSTGSCGDNGGGCGSGSCHK